MQDHHSVQSSDRVSVSEVLDVFVNQLPISTWRYDNEQGTPRHIGPMAQDMHRLFEVGDGRAIPVVDFLGLLGCCVQELGHRSREQEARIKHLESLLERTSAATSPG